MEQNLLEYILNVSRRLAETQDISLLLNDVMDEAIELVGAERGYVVLVRLDGSLDFRIKRGQIDRGRTVITSSNNNHIRNRSTRTTQSEHRNQWVTLFL